MWHYTPTEELFHYGVSGMKWGYNDGRKNGGRTAEEEYRDKYLQKRLAATGSSTIPSTDVTGTSVSGSSSKYKVSKLANGNKPKTQSLATKTDNQGPRLEKVEKSTTTAPAAGGIRVTNKKISGAKLVTSSSNSDNKISTKLATNNAVAKASVKKISSVKPVSVEAGKAYVDDYVKKRLKKVGWTTIG